MNGRKRILTAIIILSTAMVVIVGIYAVHNNIPSGNTVTASLVINSGTAMDNETIWTYNLSVKGTNSNISVKGNISFKGTNTTVYGLLKEVAHDGNFSVKYTYYGQYDSILIDSIAGVVNGEESNYWQYWINGEYGIVGADRQPLNDNDTVEWKFTTFS